MFCYVTIWWECVCGCVCMLSTTTLPYPHISTTVVTDYNHLFYSHTHKRIYIYMLYIHIQHTQDKTGIRSTMVCNSKDDTRLVASTSRKPLGMGRSAPCREYQMHQQTLRHLDLSETRLPMVAPNFACHS